MMIQNQKKKQKKRIFLNSFKKKKKKLKQCNKNLEVQLKNYFNLIKLLVYLNLKK